MMKSIQPEIRRNLFRSLLRESKFGVVCFFIFTLTAIFLDLWVDRQEAVVEEWRELLSHPARQKLFVTSRNQAHNLPILKKRDGDFLFARIQFESELVDYLLDQPLEVTATIDRIGLYRQGRDLLLKIEYRQSPQYHAELNDNHDGFVTGGVG